MKVATKQVKANAELLPVAKAAKVDHPAPTQGSVIDLADGKAQGYGIAQSIIGIVTGQANDLMRYVRRLAMITAEGRDVCRKELALHVRQMGDIVKATSPTGKIGEADPIFKGAKSSAIVRLSEFGKVIKALDAGMDLQFKVDPQTKNPLVDSGGLWVTDMKFHECVARARVTLGSQAQGRGRPAKPFIDRLKDLVEKYAHGQKDLHDGEELLRTMIQR